MNKLNQYMFREYDIRGRESSDELNAESVGLIVKAFGTFLRKKVPKALTIKPTDSALSSSLDSRPRISYSRNMY